MTLNDKDVRKAFRVWFAGLTQQQRVGIIRGHQQTFNDVLDMLHGDESDADVLEVALNRMTDGYEAAARADNCDRIERMPTGGRWK